MFWRRFTKMECHLRDYIQYHKLWILCGNRTVVIFIFSLFSKCIKNWRHWQFAMGKFNFYAYVKSTRISNLREVMSDEIEKQVPLVKFFLFRFINGVYCILNHKWLFQAKDGEQNGGNKWKFLGQKKNWTLIVTPIHTFQPYTKSNLTLFWLIRKTFLRKWFGLINLNRCPASGILCRIVSTFLVQPKIVE